MSASLSQHTAKILLVDDRPENLLALEAILEPLGQDLVRADSGDEALRRLLHDDYAVILLDVQMPRLDGFQTAELIKQRERSRHVPIIFLTALSKDADNVFRGYEAGAVDYITKPFDPSVLRAKVSVFIELWQKTVELQRHEGLQRARELAALERESEERYRFLGDSIPQQVWTALPDGALDYVNERVIAYFGRTFEEMIGWGWSELVHADDLQHCIDSWSASLASGALYECEFRLHRSSDSAYRWHLARALPMRGDDGEIVQWFGTNTDIEERRVAEDRQQFLAEAGWALGSSLDYARTLSDVAELVVPKIADWCAVDVFVDDRLQRLALAHVDPLKLTLARELDQPMLAAAATPGAAAIHEQEAVLVEHVDEAALAAFGFNEQQLEIARALAPRSYVTVPLVARGVVLGAISLITAESGRTYGADDLALARELARHAAIAIDNAKLYEQAQRRAQAARVLASIGDGVVLIDRDDVVRLWNPAAAAILGLSEADVLGRRIDEIIPGWSEIAQVVPVAVSPSEPVRAETTPVELDGRELWISGTGVAVEEGTVYAFRDRTEEHALEKMRADFVATVSHELRTPLAAIYGSAQTIRRPDLQLDEEIRDELLGVIATESDRLASIVNDLLLSSHLDSGRLPVQIESCDAGALVGAVVDSARTHLPEAVELTVDAAAGLPPVAADRGQLSQVLTNLVDNAIKYSPGGGTVAVSLQEVNGAIRFTVADRGLGMPPSELGRIFEKFYRLDPDMTRGIGGTGLGLYISRELVHRMDGTISVTSRHGEGSTFVVELPAAKQPAKQRPKASAKSR
ncbi:MAG: response regulator [Actinobacteria bacterium]|nr:response regulator [Actinomycetota bacterium]